MNFDADVKYLKGVGPKRAELLAKVGVKTVGDLLTYFPRAYTDYSKIYSIASAPQNENVCIRAYVGSPCRENYIRKGMTTYTFDVTDGQSAMSVVFFNNKYVSGMLKQGEEYIFYGKLTTFGYYRSMTAPKFTPVSEEMNDFTPIYPQTAGMQSHHFEKIIKTAFDSDIEFEDCIPVDVRNDYCLMNYRDALYNIHFPKSEDLLIEAKRRISFQELLLLQLGLAGFKLKKKKKTSSAIEKDYTHEFLPLLPFELTEAQKRAIDESIKDMLSGYPMNRLLQGDVGSGKTAVCAAVMYTCIKNSMQAAIMAPTEVLAQQHFKTFNSFFEKTDFNIALLTGSTPLKQKNLIKSQLESGEIDLVVGTHAIISKDVKFHNLGIAVTDEQHRFGVNQRGLLNAKGDNPHILVMSATPIPRTLSLIIYGDLDLSVLDEMPKGRQKTETYLIDTQKRERAYSYVKKHLCEGYQGYIVCPLVENDENAPSDNDKVASTELYERLSEGFFKGFKLGLLYGKMKSQEKKKVMEKFAKGEIDLLISTTVIEVGVDVPNAVIMVIENAESFGLSQLHQLRGRVGRGDVKATCILVSDSTDEITAQRLKIMTSTTDGFKIADEDLKLRGPGDFFGERQHGLPDLKLSSSFSDGDVIRETHSASEKIIAKNPTLSGEEYALLKKNVNQLFARGAVLN